LYGYLIPRFPATVSPIKKEENMSEVMAVVNNTPKTEVIKNAGFAKRSALDERIAKDEEELKTLVQNNTAPAEQAESDEMDEEPTSAEEKSFKKRYGDLRRHSQKQQMEFQKQIDELRAQLEQSTKAQIKLPKSEEELQKWAAEYPDVAKIVETIAIKKAKEQAADIETRLKQIDEMQLDAMKQKAEAELMRMHPDFDQIRDQDEFHSWVEAQPKWVQQALYENETDAVSAARAIDLYKADMGITKKSRKDSDREAAKGIATGRSTAPEKSAESGVIRESEVEKMSQREYEARQEEIVAAIRAGKFVYDLSGNAR
jgi:DNA repair exonuclease SbcCD ATPase subunit